MSGRLKAYDGAVDGADISHGLVVVKSEAAAAADFPPGSEALSHRPALERVLERAVGVIGTREEAMRWLGTPVRALNYATPVSLLADDAGADQVLAVLANLENGVL